MPTIHTQAGGGSVEALSLEHIASWQVDGLRRDGEFERVQAVLPALQRGAVWRAGQVEALWDSLERRFPIGMFLLTDFRDSLKSQGMLIGKAPRSSRATHMLLDGQQRANAIALGYYSPWATREPNAAATLWMDIGQHEQSETSTSYHVVTRAHPWGYPHRDKQRLEMREVRAAIKVFREVSPNFDWNDRPPVAASWPWEACIPIPVAAVLRASSSSPDDVLAEMARTVPFWDQMETAKGVVTPEGLREALRRSAGRLKHLFDSAKSYQVPAQTVALEHPLDNTPADTARADPTETLFVRVNAGGTPLQGEDLVYSIIKAIWPNAGAVVDQLQKRFVSAPRTAMLIARLALVPDSNAKIPAVLDVTRFRRLVHGSERAGYRKRLEKYLRLEASSLFSDAYDLLTVGAHGLPPVLAADLARGEDGREVILLILRWIERLHQAGARVSDLSLPQRRRAVGALSCIRWFAPRADRCAATLWEQLEACAGRDLANFFSRKNLLVCFKPVKNQVPICLVPPPNLLLGQLRARVIPSKGPLGPVAEAKSKLWRSWEWYEDFASNPYTPLTQWYRAALPDIALGADANGSADLPKATDRQIDEWERFADKVWGARQLVLYAQRDWLRRWFPRFDPTDPESVEEINRPWDMDHIHPRHFIEKRHHIPKLIRMWHSCIGNLRAWPFEANRADAEGAPGLKLGLNGGKDAAEESAIFKSYGVLDAEERLLASFIDSKHAKLWKESTPPVSAGMRIRPSYLADAAHAQEREKLMKAIAYRLADLYREWYESTDIASLLPDAKR